MEGNSHIWTSMAIERIYSCLPSLKRIRVKNDWEALSQQPFTIKMDNVKCLGFSAFIAQETLVKLMQACPNVTEVRLMWCCWHLALADPKETIKVAYHFYKEQLKHLEIDEQLVRNGWLDIQVLKQEYPKATWHVVLL